MEMIKYLRKTKAGLRLTLVPAVVLLLTTGFHSVAADVPISLIFEDAEVGPVIVAQNESVHIKIPLVAYGWAAQDVWAKFTTPSGTDILFYSLPGWPEVCELYYAGGKHETRPSIPASHGALTVWERNIPVAALFKEGGPGVYKVSLTIRWEPQDGKSRLDQHTEGIGTFMLISGTENPLKNYIGKEPTHIAGPRQAEDKDGDKVICLLHFNEGKGEKAFDDNASNLGRHSDAFLRNNPKWVDGKFGKGILFAGADDFLEIPESGSLEVKDGALTVEAYIKPNLQTTGYVPLISRVSTDKTGSPTGWSLNYFALGGGTVILGFAAWNKGEVIMDIQGKTRFEEGQWYDVAGVTDGEMGRVYVNGKLVGYGGCETRRLSNYIPAPILIGNRAWGGKYKGTIDEICIANKVKEGFEASSSELPVSNLDEGRPTEEYGLPVSRVDWGKVSLVNDRANWFGKGRCRINVEVSAEKRGETPVYLDIDLDQIRHQFNVGKAPGKISVEVYGKDKEVRFPSRVDTAGQDKFRIRWRADTRITTKYAVYLALSESVAVNQEPEDDYSLLGDGDRLKKKKTIGPLVTMAPGATILDWDGDGHLDLITTQFGFPPNPFSGVRVYRNVKDDPKHPLFDKGTPLKDDQGRYLYLGGIRNGYWNIADVKFVDWDGNGKRDILSWGERGRFYYYENRGTDAAPVYVENTKKFKQVNGKPFTGDFVGGWYFDVVSWNSDGVYDLVCLQNGRLKLFKNANTNSNPVMVSGPYLEMNGKPISGVYSFTIADWDGDGKFDLVLALEGSGPAKSIVFLKNEGSSNKPLFKKAIPIQVDGSDLMGPIHARPIVVDWNHDGKQDLIITSQFSNDIYLNTGSKTEPALTKAGFFTTEEHFISLDFAASVSVVDWDNDGNYDLISGNATGRIYYFRNAGSNKNPVFAEPVKIQAGGKEIHLTGSTDPGEEEMGYSRPVAVDWSGTGKLDLIAGDALCRAHFYENVGTRSKPVFLADQLLMVNGQPLNFKAGRRVRPAVVDWNNDGKLDLLCASEGYLKFFERIDKLNLKPGVLVRYPDGQSIPLGERSTVVAVDWDGDGKKDLIIQEGVQANTLWNWLDFYKSIGNGNFAKPAELKYPLISAHESGPDVIDWNGNGDMDIVIGNGDDGCFYYFEGSYFTPPQVKVESISAGD